MRCATLPGQSNCLKAGWWCSACDGLFDWMDGSCPIPDSLVGRELQVSYFVVHGQENRIADNIHVIRGFNVRVSELILAGLASGAVVTAPG
jgi:hypothetical protein